MRRLLASFLVACLLDAALGRKFIARPTDTEILHGTVAMNVTANTKDAAGEPVIAVHEMHVPVEIKVKKGTQLPETLHFQNTLTPGRALRNSYKKLGLPQLAEKIRNFKINE